MDPSATRTRSRVDLACTVAGAGALVLIAVWAAAMGARHLEFDPVDGHFQNFNAVTRLLHGQRPFVDFSLYLGLGPLLLPFPLFAALGASLAASNFAYDFTSILATGLCFVVVMRLCGLRNAVAWPAAAVSTAFPWPFERGNDSALGIRSALPFAMAAVLAGLARLQSRGTGPVRLHMLAGAAAGLMPLWSNDYGLPSAACFAAVFLSCFMPGRGHRLASWAAFCAAAACTFLGVLALVTGGHPGAWVTFNFGSVLGDQFWYYNPVAAGKVYSLWDVPHDPLHVVIALPCAILGVRWLLRIRDVRRGALAALAGATTGGAFVACLAGTSELRYFLPLIRTACVLVPYCGAVMWPRLPASFPGRRTLRRLTGSEAVTPILAVYALAGAAYLFVYQARGNEWVLPTEGDVPVPELGGAVLPSYMPAIEVARGLRAAWDAQGVPPDQRLLSTYATAPALIAGSRQEGVPDYVIHALGDKAREQFTAALDAPYRMVETSDPALMLWGHWNIRETWPFYRKLYQDWHPVGRTPWSLLWARRQQPLPAGAALSCRLAQDPDGSWTVSVDGAPAEPWTAEVEVDLHTSFKPGPVPMIGSHRLLEVVEDYDGADRHVDEHSGFGEFMSLVSNTWTLRLADGPVTMPISTGKGLRQTLLLRAWPRDRASLSAADCHARLVAPVSETSLPETAPRGGTVVLNPRLDGGPPQEEPYPARKDTHAVYMLTKDPLSPAGVRVGDEVTFPDGRRGRVLMRDFRLLTVEWPGGGPFKDAFSQVTVSSLSP